METRNKGRWPTEQKYDTAELMLRAAGWQFIRKEKEYWFKSPDQAFFVKARQTRHRVLEIAWHSQFNTSFDEVSFDV